MKSLRYLLVITWVCTMASLGLFSDIESLKDLFARCHFGGDANVPGIALLESPLTRTITPPATPETSDTKAESQAPACQGKWLTCTQKKPVRCQKSTQKACKKRVCKPKEHASVQEPKTNPDSLAVAFTGTVPSDLRGQG